MDTTKQENLLHYTMSFIGGIFGIYALLEHSNVFGSAETSNLIMLVENLLDRDAFHTLIRIGCLLMYAVGIILTIWISKYHLSVQKRICILIDGIAALILGILPRSINPIIAIYPIAFAMSFQWCSFRGVHENISATTFSTGNFRHLVTGIFNYISDKKHDDLLRIKFYILTMLAFHSGVAVIYIVWPYIPHHCIWLAFIPLSVAAILEFVIRQRKLTAGNI